MVGYLPSSRTEWRQWNSFKLLKRATPFLALFCAYAYTRSLIITHDAQLAGKFCPHYVSMFKRCEHTKRKCKKEIIELHDCICRFRGINQIRKDLY